MTGTEVLRMLKQFQAAEKKGRGVYHDLQRLQMRYGSDCFLRRLAQTSYRSQFVLKGALLLVALDPDRARNTKDADFQVYGRFAASSVRQAFVEICSIPIDDGITFRTGAVEVTGTGDNREYPGFSVTVPALLGASQLRLRFDIGFGEAITPHPTEIDYPVLLGMPSPRIRSTTWETVVAEKFQAIVELGMRNNRMKDYFDIADLGLRIEFRERNLAQAIQRTFEQRRTKLPSETPIGLTPAFTSDQRKRKDWQAFLGRHSLPKNTELGESAQLIAALVMPVIQSLIAGTSPTRTWTGSRWVEPQDLDAG